MVLNQKHKKQALPNTQYNVKKIQYLHNTLTFQII